MADELNVPTHRWYEPRNNIALASSDFSKQYIFDSGIQKIDAFIGKQPWGNPVQGLFALAEPGVWYDPSDLTTLFQDTAGTTPVTTPGQTVALALDKSKGLVLGPELVTNGTFNSGIAGWTANANATLSYTGSAIRATRTTDNDFGVNQTISGLTSGRYYAISVQQVGGSATGFYINIDTFGNWPALAQRTGTFSGVFQATSSSFALSIRAFGAYSAGATIDFDNISVKELPGFHATQATAASRPTYGIVPQGGRRNLFRYSQDFTNGVWTKSGTATVTTGQTDPLGGTTAAKIEFASIFQFHGQSYTFSGGETITHSVWLRGDLAGTIRLTDASGGAWSKQVSISTTWQRFDVTATNVAAGPRIVAVSTGVGDLTTVYVAFQQLELVSTATNYQRVGSAFDVTEAGVQSLGYLSFDGVDDFLVTPTITPGIDKAQVFAGVRKLGNGMIAEFSAYADANNGSFYHYSGEVGAGDLSALLRGTQATKLVGGAATLPVTRVETISFDIAGTSRATEIFQRINGVAVSGSPFGAADAGTGNFLAYPLYIGRRGGTTLPFNGQIYSLVVRFGANLDQADINRAERWVADKTGVTL